MLLSPVLPPTNFVHLQEHSEQLLRLGMLAEKYFTDDPNTCLLKLRQLAELLAQMVATRVGLFVSADEAQYELLRRLQDEGILPREVAQLFGEIRRSGNSANHALIDDHRTALANLKLAWQISIWFHRTFQNPAFKSGAFIPPTAPADESNELRIELTRLNQTLQDYQKKQRQTAQQLQQVQATLQTTQEEQLFWEQMAIAEGASKADRSKAQLAERLAAQQAATIAQPKSPLNKFIQAANRAAQSVNLDEASTRQLIDEQLRQAGWEADSVLLQHRKGIRPEKGVNRAIAEWPTGSGPVDYVLFVGLMPIATIEAKRQNTNVSSALQQAKRYSRDFRLMADHQSPGGTWDGYGIPFVFSSNGRPYLRQIETLSGIWFCDVRRAENLAHALDGWYTPAGLVALLKQDVGAAHESLAAQGFEYSFQLRPYQQDAIRAVEARIVANQRELLVAMATGTGKTKTCIALIYRLLKAQRFRRLLFLVDRSALGEQAANAFKDTRLENLQTFADAFGIKELTDQAPDTATAVHIATIQGMVKRILYAGENTVPPPIDQYDCIVVDECHRGYLLDREMADTEMTFRSFDDYISKYRRVLDYFDAIKIGLTATPALHTTQVFGEPVYTYSYREAVIDGFLVDHEPPLQIQTHLSKDGINWRSGEEVKIYNPQQNQIDLFMAPDEIQLEVESFNRKVITQDFNRVVCSYLAGEIDPNSQHKTLIFCATDAHADLVVTLLKQEFEERYDSIADDAVIKITGTADKPLQLIRRYKNERYPNVAVTVDLLTTGIDVPRICNLVFLRRINSRILYDQMVGRATRLCPEIGKESFRIFDAVRLYEALEQVTAMKPVVVNPQITFGQLLAEMSLVMGDEARSLIRDQLIAKLQRKKRRLSEESRGDFEIVVGMAPEEFIQELRQMPLEQVANWFTQNPQLGEILDRQWMVNTRMVLVSEHPDELYRVDRGYGQAQQPEDYLQAFNEFIRSNSNTLPALMTVLTRPKDLTRKQLRELVLELDKRGFTETNLATAWREMTNQDIAARIVGYIRQAAIGDALEPYAQRVDRALQKILASRDWTMPQRQWLQKIAAQTKANLVVDRDALDDPDLVFRREGGGFTRLDRIFNGELQQVLADFNDGLWPVEEA
jgi:type I restriction enzyme, R subunit